MRGSIRRRGRASFEIRLELERTGGKRSTRSITVRGSHKEAQKRLTELLKAADEGALPTPTQQTVEQYSAHGLTA